MPETAAPPTAPPPTQVQQGVTPTGAGQTIHLDKRPISQRPEPNPGSARFDLEAKLRSKSGQQPTQPASQAPAPKQPPPAPPEVDKEPELEKPAAPSPSDHSHEDDGAVAFEEGKQPAPKTDEAPKDDPAKKGANPWKLLKASEAKIEELTGQLSKLQSGKLTPQEQQAQEQKVTAMQARLKELEDEMRFVNFTKTSEYQEKYVKPYEQQWTHSMKKLARIMVQDGETERAITPEDLAQFVGVPLDKRTKQLAEQMFGEFSGDVLDEAGQLGRLWDAQTEATAQARKMASERDQQRQATLKQTREQLRNEITSTWSEVNNSIVNDNRFGPYFRPINGDEEGNASLEKGFKLVDEAFALNPLDPRLSKEERAAAIRKHAVVRHRAAAFGRLTRQVRDLSAKLSEREAKLSEYEKTTPEVDGGRSAMTPTGPISTKQSMIQRLQKAAK